VKHKALKIVIGAAIVIGVIAVASSSASNNTPAASSSATASTSATTGLPTLYSQPTTSAPITPVTVPATVTYSCTGQAPDGVDITYGPDGSSYHASKLPFSKTAALPASALYVDTEAQLHGSGEVTCTTTVNADGTTATKSGTAQGGYNLALAEVCDMGGWSPC